MNRRLGTLICLLSAAFGAHAAPPRPACLGEYRSLERQAAWSPLIVIGAIEEVKESPYEERANREDSPPPTIAGVRVLKILKGSYDGRKLQVKSGPVRSCAPWPVHYAFRKGDTRIFIFPDTPKDGMAQLEFGGSLLEPEEVSKVQSRLTGARVYRDSYLEEIRPILPKAHGDAVALAKEMRAAASTWPSTQGWPEEKPEFAAAKRAVLARLAKVEVEAIRAAVAVDWLEPGSDPWWRTRLWKAAMKDVVRARGAEVERTERARLRRDLARAGVEEDFARRYEESVDFAHDRLDIEFPPDPLDLPKPAHRQNVTTEFILRAHAYDRGALFSFYGMRFEILADLDPARVSLLLPAFYGSDDEDVRLVASRAIERIPGTPFVDVVLRRLLDEPWAWFALKHPEDAEQTAARLVAAMDRAEKTLTPYGVACLWRNLGKGGCFEAVCVDRAIASLSGAKERLTESLHEYLQAAMTERRLPPERLSPEDYRKWFASHPLPKK